MSFTEGHIFFYFTLSGEPLVLQLNKSILKYMCRVEDLPMNRGFAQNTGVRGKPANRISKYHTVESLDFVVAQ